MKKRIEWVDLAKGICIILVMWWHVRELYSNRGFTDRPVLLYTANYFRMPLYFLLSGLFFKTYSSYLDFLIRKTNKLFVPYLTFAVLGVAFCLVYADKLPQLRTWQSFYPFVTIWFLQSLFIINSLFYLLQHIAEGNRLVLYLSVAVLAVMGYNAGRELVDGLHLYVCLTALPFFAVGYALRSETNYLYYKSRWWELLLGIALIGVLYLFTLRHGKADLYYVHNEFHLSIWLLYLTAFTGIFAIMAIARVVKHIPVVSYLGRYSIVVLITHYPILYLAPRHWSVVLHAGFGQWCAEEELLLLIAIEVPIIALCTHFFPWVFAQKDLIPLRVKK